MRMIVPRPFLKWAGGKTRIANFLSSGAPPTFKTYHEPFLGGGALFFQLYRDGRIVRAILSDINAELIDTYIAVRDRVSEVIEILSGFPHSKEFYYKLRDKDPWSLSCSERAARMIYLNKTGYNGLYRLNRKGNFNVPFGNYKNPRYIEKGNLHEVSKALQGVELLQSSFETVLDRAESGDLVYFDPPYLPVSKTSSFTSYYHQGFSTDNHYRLRDVCIGLHKKDVYIMLSNSDTPESRTIYKLPFFTIQEVFVSRPINSCKEKRGKVKELLMVNY